MKMNGMPICPLFLLLISWISISGCGIQRIVTHDANFSTDYEEGQTYILKVDVLAAKESAMTLHLFGVKWVALELNNQARENLKIQETEPPESRTGFVLPAGTTLRFNLLGYYKNIDSEFCDPVFEILDGPLKGKLISLMLFSRYESNRNWDPHLDPRFLQRQ